MGCKIGVPSLFVLTSFTEYVKTNVVFNIVKVSPKATTVLQVHKHITCTQFTLSKLSEWPQVSSQSLQFWRGDLLTIPSLKHHTLVQMFEMVLGFNTYYKTVS